MLKKLDIHTLADLDDGRIAEALTQAMRRAESDCRDRPGLEKARKVTLEITYKPVPSESGELETVDVSFQVQERSPKRESRNYNMLAGREGFMFSEHSPDDVKQGTLYDALEGKKKANAC